MKALHLHLMRELKSPVCKEVEEMLTIEQERSIELPDGGIGYILGDRVIAPFFYKKSCIGRKYDRNVVLTYETTSPWGISYFKLPFGIPCELLHFRREHLHADTFFFKVSDNVELCRASAVNREQGRFELKCPADFAPVFDRHTHLLGFNIGLLKETRLFVHIKEILI